MPGVRSPEGDWQDPMQSSLPICDMLQHCEHVCIAGTAAPDCVLGSRHVQCIPGPYHMSDTVVQEDKHTKSVNR